MVRVRRGIEFAVLLLVLAALGMPAQPRLAGAPAGPPTLVAIPVDQAPMLDGKITEEFWSRAPVLIFKTEGAGKWGAQNSSETTIRVRGVYTKDSIYLLMQWNDPTFSVDRQRWAFEDGRWQLEDQTPLERGGSSTFYEDKMAMMWVMSSPSVVDKGTFYPTYVDEDDSIKYGYRRPVKAMPRGERLDMWHWKLVRSGFTNPPQIDDQYVDETLDARTAANAGRKTDPDDPKKPGGYYDNIKSFTAPDGRTVRGPRFYIPGKNNVYIITQEMIDRGEAKEIASYGQLLEFAAGTRLPGVIGRRFTGSRADITAGWTWKDRVYTLEIGRKLDTGDPQRDVIFSDLSRPYYFGVGIFDNNQIGHAVSDVMRMIFRKR
ncbi:MAG: hypothetical protein HY660_11305 [Armatimonadetes bacterium]|nr:hypothetical protein [Armatimonadota bacterium]